LPPERDTGQTGRRYQITKILQAGNRQIKRIMLSVERKDNFKGRVLDPEARDKDLVARAKNPEGRASSHRL